MIFLLLENAQDGACPDGCVKIINGTLSPIRVTSDGHRLLSGQIACVSQEDPEALKAIERGQATEITPEDETLARGKKLRKNPKVRGRSTEGAAPNQENS